MTANSFYGTSAGMDSQMDSSIAIGYKSGEQVVGFGNVFIGNFTGSPDGNSANMSNQLMIDNGAGWRNRFNSLIWGDFKYDSLRFNAKVRLKDTLFYDYIKPATSGTRFIVLTGPNGGADTGVLNPVSRGLTDPLWDVHKHLADTKDKEVAWYYIDSKTGEVVKTYKLPNNMHAFEALQYTAEMSLRLIAEQDKRIALLERKQIRMTRQDYKYKAKLLKLESKLTKK